MKIRLTQTARQQLAVIVDTYSNETGFMLGQDIGKYRIIEGFLPINFYETDIDEIYAKIYSKIGKKLVGVFFNNKEAFHSEWFIEDVVIKIKHPQPEFYLYNADMKPVRLEDVMI